MNQVCRILVVSLWVLVLGSPSLFAEGDLGQIVRLKRVAKKIQNKALERSAEKLWNMDFCQRERGDSSQLTGDREALRELPEFPNVLQQLILQNLGSLSERCAASSRFGADQVVSRSLRQSFRAYQREQIDRFLEKVELISLPEVTVEDVAYLQQAQVSTSIQVMPGFRAANVKNSVGLYKAVMGAYPDLRHTGLSIQQATRVIQQWNANPDLPLVYTTSAEDEIFANRLSRITGRKFKIMSNAQNEYSIRGRQLVGEAPLGNITVSTYYFGEGENQVKNHAFIASNAGSQPHGVHEIPEGANASDFKNTFGLIHPIGNVYVRSLDGVFRGGAFSSPVGNAESSYRNVGCRDYRNVYMGSRLAEDL